MTVAAETLDQVTIDHLGAQGDGVAQTADGPVYLPYTLPGERVSVRTGGGGATLATIDAPSPQRREAPCPHFSNCGGCDLQHASADLYAAYKRDKVAAALARAGLDAPVDDFVPCAPRSRRRVVFSARRDGAAVTLGFNAAGSNRIVAIGTCPIAEPAIEAALPALRDLAGGLAGGKAALRLAVTRTDVGLDVFVDGAGRVGEAARQRAVACATKNRFARLSVGGEVWLMREPPTLDIDGTSVVLPVGGFVQPVAAAEAAMVERVAAHLARCKTVGDLYSGFGAFALRLARRMRVHAMEFDAGAIASLDRARREAQGLKPITAERRDLDRRPPIPRELMTWDGVVFDPPRAGAEAVARALAGSKVKRVAAVSCNPATLARDLRILVDGGYRIESVTPIDQFLWSHHVEAVALLRR